MGINPWQCNGEKWPRFRPLQVLTMLKAFRRNPQGLCRNFRGVTKKGQDGWNGERGPRCMPFDALQVLKMFKTPPFRGFFVESWILVKMDQFWNCNYGSPFPSNTQELHHFGKPQGSPLRWSNQFLMVASILGAISPWMCGIGGPIPKKSVLIWIISSGYLNRHLLRIPKWYVTPWNGHSKYLQIEKKNKIWSKWPSVKWPKWNQKQCSV